MGIGIGINPTMPRMASTIPSKWHNNSKMQCTDLTPVCRPTRRILLRCRLQCQQHKLRSLNDIHKFHTLRPGNRKLFLPAAISRRCCRRRFLQRSPTLLQQDYLARALHRTSSCSLPICSQSCLSSTGPSTSIQRTTRTALCGRLKSTASYARFALRRSYSSTIPYQSHLQFTPENPQTMSSPNHVYENGNCLIMLKGYRRSAS